MATTGLSGTFVPGMIQFGTIAPILPARSAPDKARRTPGAALRRGEIDLLDDGMGMRRSQHRHMQHARRLDVVGIASLAGDELEILAPAQRLADIFDRGCFSHGDAPPRLRDSNGTHDVGVAGAAADIAGEVVTDFVLGRVRVSREQLADRHDHPRRAEAALQGVVLMEGRLDRMQGAVAGCEAFDGRDRRTVGHHGENRAGFDRLSIDIDGAGAALRRVAPDMGSGQTKIVAEKMNQKLARFDRSGPARAIDLEGDDILPFSGFAHSFLRRRVMKLHLLRMRVRVDHEKRMSAISIATKTGLGIAVHKVAKLGHV